MTRRGRLLYFGSMLLGPFVLYGVFWFVALNDWCYQRFSNILFRSPESWSAR